MELKNVFLWASLAFVLMLIYQQWQVDYGHVTPPVASEAPRPGQQNVPQPSPTAPARADNSPANLVQPVKASGQRIHIRTDVLDLELDTLGGDIRKALLPTYPVSVDKPDIPFQLMGDDELSFIAQSGLVDGGDKKNAPNHHAVYRAEKTEYVMAEGQDKLEVVLSWQSNTGLQVNKVYTLQRGSHTVDVRFDVQNNTGKGWSGYMYRQLQHSRVDMDMGIGMLPTYTGAVYSGFDSKKDEAVPYEKYDFDDMAERALDRTLQGGWVAMIQHYFLVALVPEQGKSNKFYSLDAEGDRFSIGMIENEVHRIAAGAVDSFQYKMFIGPKDQDMMEALAPNLHLAVDYGFVTLIADPLFWLLKWLHGLIGNWGWSIIAMTILLKAAFYQLSAKGYKSMAKMRKVNPRIQVLKERFGEDKQGFQQAMMKLWKEEKVNPMSGCLPILVQMPIFLAFYWVLLESVELRQADWILWYKDLSQADPYFVLPILNGISLLIQTKLSPPQTDPMMEKMMLIMPIGVSVLFAFFPAGLVLYWTFNSILQNIQQYMITRQIEKAG
ncbi:MAG: membrane protein insertase YidC [Gammaproteobacteria bacterium]|nr:membrane protein insertase YidC [Gammaproteobacteria bacterium]